MLRYLVASIRHPRREALGLISGGLGIEQRSKLFQEHWRGHLAKCFLAEREWLSPFTAQKLDSLTVLGAGRLLDLDQELCAKRFKEIHLVDGDPLAVSAWRRAQRLYPDTKFHLHSEELTGVMFPWQQLLTERFERELTQCTEFEKRWELALNAVRQIPFERGSAQPPTPYLRSDAILSLNILSQLPLGWQHLTERALKRYFSEQEIEARESAWVRATFVGGREIIENHLRMIESSSAQTALVITDTEYLFYDEDQNPDSLECRSMPALCEFNLTRSDELRNICPSFDFVYFTPWLWHIAPKNTGSTIRDETFKRDHDSNQCSKSESCNIDAVNNVGEIHRVAALVLNRKKDKR